jgi:hypothetical protein
MVVSSLVAVVSSCNRLMARVSAANLRLDDRDNPDAGEFPWPQIAADVHRQHIRVHLLRMESLATGRWKAMSRARVRAGAQ